MTSEEQEEFSRLFDLLNKCEARNNKLMKLYEAVESWALITCPVHDDVATGMDCICVDRTCRFQNIRKVFEEVSK